MRVRAAVSDDRDFVVGLSGRFAEPGLPSWRTAQEVASGTARHLDGAFAAPDARSAVLVAESEGGELLGFAWVLLVEDFFSGRDVGQISEIATVRDGTGAGAALMRACEAWILDRGCRLAVLNVLRDNAHARAFYERHGYEPEYTAMAKPLARQAGDAPG